MVCSNFHFYDSGSSGQLISWSELVDKLQPLASSVGAQPPPLYNLMTECPCKENPASSGDWLMTRAVLVGSLVSTKLVPTL